MFLNKHIFDFWDAQNPEKKKRVLRQARKVVGPKAPGAHRAHGPRPLGPIGPIRSHAVAWPGPMVLWASGALGPYSFLKHLFIIDFNILVID